MKKRLLFLSIVSAMATVMVRADEGTLMVTTLKDGSVRGNFLKNKPVLTFQSPGRKGIYKIEEGTLTWSILRSGVQKFWFCTAFTLNDTVTTAQTVEQGSYDAAKLYRTLTPDIWNTLCLPFGMTAKQVADTFGEGTQLRRYREADVDHKVLNFNECTEIEAGVAYLVKPTKEVADPLILDVTLTASEPADGTDSYGYGFRGLYVAGHIGENNYFLTTAGKLRKPAAGKDLMKGMRAYFVMPNMTEAEAKLYSLSLSDTPTGISEHTTPARESNTKVYGLNGQYIGTSTDNLPKGVYIVNGRKVIVSK